MSCPLVFNFTSKITQRNVRQAVFFKSRKEQLRDVTMQSRRAISTLLNFETKNRLSCKSWTDPIDSNLQGFNFSRQISWKSTSSDIPFPEFGANTANSRMSKAVLEDSVKTSVYRTAARHRAIRKSPIFTNFEAARLPDQLSGRFCTELLSSKLCTSARMQNRAFGTTAILPSSVNLVSHQYYRKPYILEGQPRRIAVVGKMETFSTKPSSEKEQYYTNKGQSSRLKLYYTLKQYIRTPDNAETFVSHLKDDERQFLLDALNSSYGTNTNNQLGNEDSGEITKRQHRLIFIHNCVPFIGFGFLDNAIMICAGEYIDLTIGLKLGISTMAAAALGNLISDLAGIGLAGYVEILFLKLGLPVAALTPEQAEQPSTIFSSNMGKFFGIFVGCILGMFPLLFIKKEEEKDENSK